MFKPVFACVLMALWLCASAAARVPDTNAEPELLEMKSVWKPYPLDIDLFFDQRYPELEARRWKYYQAILSASKPQMVEAHNPTIVRVNLSADATITGTTVTQSSGNTYLDRAAIDAARQSTYCRQSKAVREYQGGLALG